MNYLPDSPSFHPHPQGVPFKRRLTPKAQTVCDALRATEIGASAFSIIQKIGVATITASDGGVVEAQAKLAHEADIQAEPSGALPLAAVLENDLSKQYRKIWIIVSGGNA